MAKKEKEDKAKSNGKVQITQEKIDKMRDAITASFEGQPLVGDKREYSSGSVGYNVTGKIVVDGVKCQVACNVIVVGSKELAKSKKK